MEKCLLLGNGGREAALAEFISGACNASLNNTQNASHFGSVISGGYSLYSVLPYENPSIVEYISKSGGKYTIGDPFNKELVGKFIIENEIDTCVISSDNLLQAGLIDVAQALGLKTFGPTSLRCKNRME